MKSGSLLLVVNSQSSLPKVIDNIPINVVGTESSLNKWSDGLLNRNWLREFHCLSPEQDCGLFELRRIGVPADALLRAGYEVEELLNGGYSESDLQKACTCNQK
jgi:hypothetical protein